MIMYNDGFLETDSVNMMHYYLSKLLDEDFVQLINNQGSKVEKINLNSWPDLENLLGDNIFDTSKSNKIVNINDLDIDKKVIQFLQRLDIFGETIYFYSTTRFGLGAVEKKLWKSAKFDYNEIKCKKNELEDIAKILNKNNKNNLNQVMISQIIEISSNVDELINNIDIVSVGQNADEIIKYLSNKELTPAYMLHFDVNRGLQNYQEWLSHSKDEEIQLMLSLIFGKLKNNPMKKLKKLLLN